MGRILLCLMVVFIGLCPISACAEDLLCADESWLEGHWVMYTINNLFDELRTERPTRVEFKNTGDYEFLLFYEAGGLLSVYNIEGKWKLDCNKLLMTTKTMGAIQTVVDNDKQLSKEELQSLRDKIAEHQKDAKSSMAKKPDMTGEVMNTVLHLNGEFLITRDDNGTLFVYRKEYIDIKK